ncbi:MAG: biotin/lipoyl-binding protein [Spirochaetales bacterium]|nr:biotin/lipoyl-binding protein [Spirochaetales bacterium]
MKTYRMTINGETYRARIVEYSEDRVVVNLNDVDWVVEIEQEEGAQTPRLIRAPQKEANVLSVPQKATFAVGGAVTAPLPGVIKSILVKEGDTVQEGDALLVLEAMKMDSEIDAGIGGIVKKICVAEGAAVQEGETLVEIGR